MEPNLPESDFKLSCALREKLAECLRTIEGDSSPTPETVFLFWGSRALRASLISQFKLSTEQTTTFDQIYADLLEQNPEFLKAKLLADRARSRFRDGLNPDRGE